MTFSYGRDGSKHGMLLQKVAVFWDDGWFISLKYLDEVATFFEEKLR